jgi:hypothetical protein
MTTKKFKIRHHKKASEAYVNVIFDYSEQQYDWDIPIQYRRTGVDFLDKTEEDIEEYINEVYEECNPTRWAAWKSEQDKFWADKPKAVTTKAFFDILAKDFKWKSVPTDLPENPNWARRIQDLKEFGYTLATNTAKFDKTRNEKCTHILLVPLARGGITGYETWSQEIREKIINTLKSYDAYEAKTMKKEGLLPDHKFPEIRWDGETKRESLNHLSDDDIKDDFQLLNNQRNLQKREVCRNCFQTGKRGIVYGVTYYYSGGEIWGKDIPLRGKDAEKGCYGCGWYDIEAWRKSLNEATSS